MNNGKKVALVTGASGGLGSAIAMELASKNYNVVLHYNSNYESILELQNNISKYNVDSMTLKADICNETEVNNMINNIIDKFGKIDLLVNNAAISMDNYLESKTVDEFKRVIDVNLNGTFIVSKYASKYMDKGVIINIASNNGIDMNNEYSMDYDASKAGIISLTKNLAKALPNIRVNVIAPGWINTKPVLEMNPDIIKEETNKIIMNRFAEPEEIAKVVSFLASDDASYINSTCIRVDGGIK